MLNSIDHEKYRLKALEIFEKAHIVLSEKEKLEMEVTDLGLGDFESIGLSTVIYIHTDRYSAEEMVLLPHQICPEHRHPPVTDPLGKQETFRCRYGEVYLYLPGEPCDKSKMKAALPKGREHRFTIFHEIILKPGEQYTIPPNTLHWFCAGPSGAVISEFSSAAFDDKDIFTDPELIRCE